MSWLGVTLRAFLILLLVTVTRSAFAVTINTVTTPTANGQPEISGTLDNGESGVAISVNGKEANPGPSINVSKWSCAVTLQEGTNHIVATALDATGKESPNPAVADIVLDTKAPTVSTATFVDATHVDLTFTEAVTGGDNPGNYVIDKGLQVSGASINGTTCHLTTTLQSASTTYTITVSNVVDMAGNVIDTTGNSATFDRPANRAPSVPNLVSPPNGTYNSNEVTTFTPTLQVAAASDPDGDPLTYIFEISADNLATKTVSTKVTAANGTASWTVAPALSDNTTYYWRALANDGYVNSGYSATGTFFVSTKNLPPPLPTVSAPTDGTTVTTLTPVLSVGNAVDPNHDTVTYDFEVASDSNFKNMVASTTGVAESTSGTTGWTVPSAKLQDNTQYFWHSRGKDQHGVTGEWVVASFFANTANDPPTAPTLNAPPNANGVYNVSEVKTTPALVVNNATDADGDPLTYTFEIDTSNAFNTPQKQNSPAVAQGSGTTSWTPATLSDNTLWYWRVKANDGQTDSAWMTTGSFFVNAANDAPTAPTGQSPADNGRVASLKPTLSINPSTDLDHDPLTYEYAVCTNPNCDGTSQVAGAINQGTSWTVNSPLQDLKTYYWSARAKDPESPSAWMPAQSFFVDSNGKNDPPSITVTAPGPTTPPITANSSSTYTISWSASDPDSNPTITLYYDVNSSGNGGTEIVTGIRMNDPSHTYSWDTSALPDGTYYIYAGIMDETPTMVFSTYAGPLVIDRTPPASPILQGAAATNVATPTWSWSSGGGGNGTFRYRLDNPDLTSSATTADTSFTPSAALAQGNHTLYIQESDAVGNWSGTAGFTTAVDTTPPYITGASSTTATGNYPAGTSINLTVAFSERVSTDNLTLYLNSGAILNTGPLASVTSYSTNYIVAAGENAAALNIKEINGTINDAAGNAVPNPSIPAGNNIADKRILLIDTTAPTVAVAPTAPHNAIFTASATATDNSALTYVWSKVSGPGDILFSAPNALTTSISASSDGSYLLRFTATDPAGNASSADVDVVWDTLAPTVSSVITTAASGAYRSGSALTLTLTFSEPVSSAGLTLSLNSGATISTATLTGVTSVSSTYTVADGQNSSPLSVVKVSGTIRDAAGNATTDPSIAAGGNLSDGKTIVIDTILPDTFLTGTPANPTNQRSGSFAFTASETDAHFECSIDGGAFTSCTSPYSFDFSAQSDGSHAFSVRANDPAGNIDATPASFSWVIKTTVPTATVTALPPLVNTASATISVGGDAVASYRYQLDSGGYLPETPVATPIELKALSEGSHTVQVIAKDSAGNSQDPAAATSLTWTVDLTPPVFQQVSTLPDGSYTNRNELNIAGTLTDTNGIASLSIEVTMGDYSYQDVISVSTEGAFSYLLQQKLRPGGNLVRLTATDSAGNSSTDIRTINFDPNAARLTITAPADNSAIATPNVTVGGNVDKELQSVQVKVFTCQQVPVLLSSQLASLEGSNFSAVANLAEGCNTIVVTVTDLAGNLSEDKRTVTYDDTKPTLAVTDPPADERTQITVVNIRGTVADTLTPVTVTVSDGTQTYTPAVVDGQFEQKVILGETRVYRFVVTATDQAGNQAMVQRNIIYARPANGDINNDGRVDVADALIALQIAAGLLQQTDAELLSGDVAPVVNGAPQSDGVIDVGDAVVILKIAVGLINLK